MRAFFTPKGIMSAEKVINALLKAEASLVALVGDKIFPGVIPQDTVLPAAGYSHISTVERTTAAMNETKTLATSRIQVSVQAKTYPAMKTVLDAVRKACKNKSGLIAGITVHSVKIDTVGPDMESVDGLIHMQTQDFKVKYTKIN